MENNFKILKNRNKMHLFLINKGNLTKRTCQLFKIKQMKLKPLVKEQFLNKSMKKLRF